MFDNSKSPKQDWYNINKILGYSRPDNDYKLIDEIGAVLTDSKIIANKFNSFFVGIGKKLGEKFTSADDFNKYGTLDEQISSIYLKPSSTNEFEVLINNLNIHKSVGSDGISNFTLKKLGPIIAPFLSYTFNMCLKHGIYPDLLKIAKVTPVFKSDLKTRYQY